MKWSGRVIGLTCGINLHFNNGFIMFFTTWVKLDNISDRNYNIHENSVNHRKKSYICIKKSHNFVNYFSKLDFVCEMKITNKVKVG